MRLLIVGGKLQGTEAAYLAAEAGWETVLVDRRPAPPAAGLVDRHIVTDICHDEALARSIVASCDAVLPACEDEHTLAWLAARVPSWGVPFLFDMDAYAVSSSKLASNQLFADLGVPRPRPWPDCSFPLVVKPSGASGSEGVSVVCDEAGLRAARERLERAGHAVVLEEYVAGPSLSIEVVSWGAAAQPLQVTGLEFDTVYDCKRVVAPIGVPDSRSAAGDWASEVPPGAHAAFDDIACRLAGGLGLNGLMDIEVMVTDEGQLKVLEIDARLPSQTPTAVLWSSGLNLLDVLYRTVVEARPLEVDRTPRRACVYQHLHARDGALEVAGEHAMSCAAPLRRVPDFFGADEALTDFRPGAGEWAATIICAASSLAEARARAQTVAEEAALAQDLKLRLEVESSLAVRVGAS